MSDDRYRFDPDGELLSAWLAGDLDRPGTEEVERRLANEPALAARLDRVHDTLIALRGLDAVQPPTGMSERLRERLAAERETPPVAALDDRRARRSRWPALSAAAAVLVLLAIVPILSRTLPGGSGTDTAAEDADLTIEQAAPEADAPGVSEEAAAAASGPVIAEGAEAARSGRDGLEGSAAVQELYAGAPEVTQLLGTPVADAETIAADHAAQIRAAAPFATIDAEPSACLDQVIADVRVAIPARVEGFLANGTARLTYVLVTASPGSEVLDVVEVRVVDAATCAAA